MRSFALAFAVTAASLVQAGPTATEKELPRRADALPTVTASGNGMYISNSLPLDRRVIAELMPKGSVLGR